MKQYKRIFNEQFNVNKINIKDADWVKENFGKIVPKQTIIKSKHIGVYKSFYWLVTAVYSDKNGGYFVDLAPYNKKSKSFISQFPDQIHVDPDYKQVDEYLSRNKRFARSDFKPVYWDLVE